VSPRHEIDVMDPVIPRDALALMESELNAADAGAAPACDLNDFLSHHARVRTRDGSYAPFSFAGRLPLVFVGELLQKVIRNTKHHEAVTIEGITYGPGALKGATIAVCGGAQFGKTVLELNVGGYVTTVEMLNFGYYTSDLLLLATIIDTKFRPDVVDQIPWMAAMISVGKGESRSGKSVNRKNAFQVSAGDKRALGYFNGMQKPPTTITLDIAVLDEVDDIPEKNIGFIAGRMTNSDVQLTCYIGTQRIHGAGQNARYLAGTMHRWMVACPNCGHDVNLEEAWPGVCRISKDGKWWPGLNDPKLDETHVYDPDLTYYAGCPDCGAVLDRDAGRLVAEHPERAKQRNWSIRISQMGCSGIPWRDQVASWFAALADPNPGAMAAWHCDRRAIPHAGAEQPITPSVLSRARSCSLNAEPVQPGETEPAQYDMSLTSLATGAPRLAGFDTGPRSWLFINERISSRVRALVWAEMIASGNAFARLLQLYQAKAFDVIFLDAGGEPDLTKRIVLAMNGLDTWTPPNMPAADLRKATLSEIGAGLTWDGTRAQWHGIRAAAVAFSLREAGGVQQDIGFTQDGRIYPLIKCNRGESIEGFVNSFLTPKEGVVQQLTGLDGMASLRLLPLQRLPRTSIGPGVTDSMLDTHLTNLRRIRDTAGHEDWADGVENHLGLAGTYAHLAEICMDSAGRGTNCGVSTRNADDRPYGAETRDREMAVPLSQRRFA